MLDFQKSLLSLYNNLRAHLRTPLGHSLLLHIVILLSIAINFDFLFPRKKLEIIPIESLTVSVINDTKIKKLSSQSNQSNKIQSLQNTIHDNKITNAKFSSVFSKLKKNNKQQKKLKKANQEFNKLFKHKLLKDLEYKKSKEINEVVEQKKDAILNESGLVLSMQEEDEIRNQIIPNWLIPAGVKNAEDLVVEVLIEIAPDGTILKTKILNPSDETNFKIAAQSAIRALLISSPLKITSKRLKKLKEFIFNFNPKDVL